MDKSLIITFYTQADSIAASRALKGKTKGRLIPTPRCVSAGCGYAWCDLIKNKDTVIKTLCDKKIQYQDAIEANL